ncbi:MAG: serine protease [Amoebophilaceae bacterium]|nr:serine protease [Amoebophilaceae bacterium]
MLFKTLSFKTAGWLFRLCCTLLISQPLLFAKNAKTVFQPTIVKRAQQAMVTIEVSTLLSAYGLPISGKVNGVVVNKAKGYILVTCSLVGRATVGTYQVTFYNGEQTEAKLLYYDPWLDYAFLKVPPTTIPKEVVAATLSRQSPTVDQPIFTFSQGKSHTHTVHTGRVSHVDNIDCFPISGILINKYKRK